MFAVQGVCFSQCKKKAEKEIMRLRGDDAPKSPEEYQQKLEEITGAIFKKAKPQLVSGELASPDSIPEFIALAQKSGGYRGLRGVKKVERKDAKGNVVISKATKKPMWDWVPFN